MKTLSSRVGRILPVVVGDRGLCHCPLIIDQMAGLGSSLGFGADMSSPHILAGFHGQEFEQEFARPEVCISY